jgi:hypothetical protein
MIASIIDAELAPQCIMCGRSIFTWVTTAKMMLYRRMVEHGAGRTCGIEAQTETF